MAADGASGAAVGLGLSKLIPAGIGAAIMVAVDWPKTPREGFTRIAVGMGVSHLLGKPAIAYMATLGLKWFNPAEHDISVYGILGALGFALASVASVLVKRFRKDPIGTARELRRAWRGEETKDEQRS